MKEVVQREFQREFHKLKEMTVIVRSKGKIIGKWIPEQKEMTVIKEKKPKQKAKEMTVTDGICKKCKWRKSLAGYDKCHICLK